MYFFLVRGCAQALIPLFIAPDKDLRLIISRLHGLFNNSQCVSIRVVKKKRWVSFSLARAYGFSCISKLVRLILS